MSSRRGFKIFYSKDNPDPEKAGKQYKPGNKMPVMNSQGIFFVYSTDAYSASISRLSDEIGNYDVVWDFK